VTRDAACRRIQKLLALAAPGSGASEEERRTAAVQVVRLMTEHGFVPGDAPASAIDLAEVAALSLRVLELEHLLATERTAHAAQLRERDERWRQLVETVRREGQAGRNKAVRVAARKGAAEEREVQARSGGEARAEKLDPNRRTEIARMAASARWTRWRKLHGVVPR